MVTYIDLIQNDSEEIRVITSTLKTRSSREKGFTYASELKRAMKEIETDTSVLKGINVWRLTSSGKWKKRKITVSNDKQALFITTPRKAPKAMNSELASTLPTPIFMRKTKGLKQKVNDAEKLVRHLDVADIDDWQIGAKGVRKLEKAKMPAYLQVDDLLTIFHHGSKSMCFVVPNRKERGHLVKAMKKMKHRYNLMAPWINNDQLLLRYIYYDVDKDKNGSINVSEFRDICKRINLKIPTDVDKIFMKFSGNKTDISIEKTLELLRELSVLDVEMPADQVWDRRFGEGTTEIDAEVFHDFLLSQGETNATLADAERLIKSINTLRTSKSSGNLGKAAFVHFLLSRYNDAFDPAALAKLHSSTKLDLPISMYWINSSHNTYLLGDQLKSKSSVEAYQNALKRGCKCLELDCWDGKVDPKTKEPVPVIYHGHTATSKMTFKDACLVVGNYLRTNPETYPIVLSLENHCSLEYQKIMAKEMKEIFGNKLYVPSEEEFQDGDLPSPEELRGMVMIKGKRPPEPDETLDEKGKQKRNTIVGKLNYTKKMMKAFQADLDAYDDDSVDSRNNSPKSSKKKKPKVPKELKKLTLLHGAKFRSFEASLAQKATTMHSIGETKISKLVSKAEKNADEWREYNQKHMTRTYPAGSRVDSSNYNPILAWAMGCQLVALNFQTSDTSLSLNDGFFRQKGRCGYIPKPASLMGGIKLAPIRLKISVLSARCIPKPKGAKYGELVDPYVEVSLHDVLIGNSKTEEYKKVKYKTPSVDDNGFNPVWKKGATFEFEVFNPDVAMIQFRIVDDDLGKDDKIADSSIPISCLRKGYRSVQLYDRNNTTTGPFGSSILFVKIE